MAKGKYKKLLKSEKAKVQLKGAKLPKGSNVTKADFKVRKIILKTQLRDTGSSGIRKHNIKECITRLKHNNSSIKLETLKNIKEVLTTFPEDVFPKFLGDLIGVCAQLSLELDKEVRREGFRVLGSLFEAVNSDLIEPFFHVLSSYLRCAMTHLNQSIQDDSLILLDTLLIHMPSLVAKYHEKIFDNFLDLISKLKNDSKPGRTLTVNLGKKTTNVKWRCKVLERLLAILRAMNERNKVTCFHKAKLVNLMDNFNKEHNEKVYLPITRNYIEDTKSLSFFFQRTTTQESGNQTANAESIKKCISVIIPLLDDSWMEIKPEDDENKNTEILLNKESALTLSLILGIMHELWTMTVLWDQFLGNEILQNWFRTSFSDGFSRNFVQNLPLSFARSDSQRGEDFLNPFKQNLSICLLFCQLNDDRIKTETDTIYCRKVLKYIHKCASVNWGKFDLSMSDLLLKIVRVILLERTLQWRRSAVKGGGQLVQEIRTLLRVLLAVNGEERTGRDTKHKIQILLCEVVLNGDLFQCLGGDLFEDWVETLPRVLLQPRISVQLMSTLLMMGTHKNESFLASLRAHQSQVLANLKVLEINGAENQLLAKRQLCNLFYWLDMDVDKVYEQII